MMGTSCNWRCDSDSLYADYVLILTLLYIYFVSFSLLYYMILNTSVVLLQMTIRREVRGDKCKLCHKTSIKGFQERWNVTFIVIYCHLLRSCDEVKKVQTKVDLERRF